MADLKTSFYSLVYYDNMAFGFGVGDIIVATQLATQVVQNAHEACGQYNELTKEVKSTETVLNRLEHYAQQSGSPLNNLDDDEKQELKDIIAGCTKVLQVLNAVLEKYNGMGEGKPAKLWKKVKFGNGEMQKLSETRAQLSMHTKAVQLYIDLISTNLLGNLQTSVDRLAASIICTHKEGSVLSTHEGDEKAFWKGLRTQLIALGFSSKTLRKYKPAIIEYVISLGDNGAFDSQSDLRDEDTNPPKSHQPRSPSQVRFETADIDGSNLSDTANGGQSITSSSTRCVDEIPGSRESIISLGSVDGNKEIIAEHSSGIPSLERRSKPGRRQLQDEESILVVDTEQPIMTATPKAKMMVESTQQGPFESPSPVHKDGRKASEYRKEESQANENTRVETLQIQSKGIAEITTPTRSSDLSKPRGDYLEFLNNRAELESDYIPIKNRLSSNFGLRLSPRSLP